MTVVYLGGPINGCTDEECKDWRAYAKSILTAGCLDPMDRDYRGRELEPGVAAEIVENDKADIRASDIILINYDKPSVGTSMEVLYAWEQDKLIIIVCNLGTKLSPWLVYHSHHEFHSISHACEFINALVPHNVVG